MSLCVPLAAASLMVEMLANMVRKQELAVSVVAAQLVAGQFSHFSRAASGVKKFKAAQLIFFAMSS
jgi:hypothetical protein